MIVNVLLSLSYDAGMDVSVEKLKLEDASMEEL